MYITFGFNLLAYKENPWLWWLHIQTCRCVIRIKKCQHQILVICWLNKSRIYKNERYTQYQDLGTQFMPLQARV